MPRHVIVDGSNLATEGRTKPSLQQLVEAVRSYMEDHPDDLLSIVVDATFGHRIDPHEVADFETAIENNELVTPPAGAVGRGDAFVLAIAKKVKGTIISNDSYQEFHGDHPWLFDEGRLVGGKPVPHIGWVFVSRTPVRGPLSRRSVKDAKIAKDPAVKDSAVKATASSDSPAAATGSTGTPARRRGRAAAVTAVTASISANEPMPTPKAPPPGRAKPATAPSTPAAAAPTADSSTASSAGSGRATTTPTDVSRREAVNPALAFIEFVSQHPVGTVVDAVIESYSSHGAYVRMGDVVGYAPLRLMGDPAPRSAREAVRLGDTLSFVVDAFHPTRRSIDLALRPRSTESVATSSDSAATESPEPAAKQKPRRGRGSAPAETPPTAETSAPETPTGGDQEPAAPSSSDVSKAPKRGRRTTLPDVAQQASAPTTAVSVTSSEPVGEAATPVAAKPARAPKPVKPTKVVKAPKATDAPAGDASRAEPESAVQSETVVSAAPSKPARKRATVVAAGAADAADAAPVPKRPKAPTGEPAPGSPTGEHAAPSKPRRASARTKKAE